MHQQFFSAPTLSSFMTQLEMLFYLFANFLSFFLSHFHPIPHSPFLFPTISTAWTVTTWVLKVCVRLRPCCAPTPPSRGWSKLPQRGAWVGRACLPGGAAGKSILFLCSPPSCMDRFVSVHLVLSLIFSGFSRKFSRCVFFVFKNTILFSPKLAAE